MIVSLGSLYHLIADAYCIFTFHLSHYHTFLRCDCGGSTSVLLCSRSRWPCEGVCNSYWGHSEGGVGQSHNSVRVSSGSVESYIRTRVHSFLQSHGNRVEMHALYPTAADNDFTPAITPVESYIRTRVHSFLQSHGNRVEMHALCLGPQLLNSVQTLVFRKTISWKRLKTSQCS